MDFYEALAQIMKEKQTTAAELSRKTGLRQAYFSDLKHSRAKDVTWDNLLLICEALDITPNDIARAQGRRLAGDELCK